MAVEIGHKLEKNDRIIVYQPQNKRAFKSGTLKGYMYEHIYNAECKLGRELLKNEVVHHIDCDKLNNNFDNLLVFQTAYDHSTFHTACLTINDLEKLENGSYKIKENLFKYKIGFGRKRLIKNFICDYCGKTFEAFKDSHRGKHIYCSIHCTNQAKRKNTV